MNEKIIIIGLGSGNEEQLSLGAYKLLKSSDHLYLRTKIHPVVSFLDQEGINYKTFDDLYDTNQEYDQVYQKIATYLLEEVKRVDSIVYAVPGHPMVAEKSVQYLLELGKAKGIEIEVKGGESFLDTLFSSLHIDPIDGFIFLNGETITRNDLDPSKNIVIGQVYNQFVASDVKLTLLELYPEEMTIWIVSNLGMGSKEIIKPISLYELDHKPEDFHHLSSVFVPMTEDEQVQQKTFSRLVEIVQTLRGPNGCPWDKEQTHQSIRKYLIEEAYELLETIDELDMDHMIEELGDVLLQVMLHAQIGDDEGYFNIYDVIMQLNQKLVRRHPHVFGDEKAEKAEEVLKRWNKIKEQEKEKQGVIHSSILQGIPKDLPAILRAYKLQKKAASVGFDWPTIEQVYQKIAEEIDELKEANGESAKDELGDVMFAVVNLARFMKIDPEEALEKTNRKFMKRFFYIEQKLKEKGIQIEHASLEIMDQYWEEAKKYS